MLNGDSDEKEVWMLGGEFSIDLLHSYKRFLLGFSDKIRC